MRAWRLLVVFCLAPASVAAQDEGAPAPPAEGSGQADPVGRPAPLLGDGTPAGGIDVPPDPQEGIEGAVEYRRDEVEHGGLMAVGALGDPADEAPVTPGEGELELPPYQGVIPGARETAEPFDGYLGRKKTYLTWIGYEPGPDRVFLQLSRPVEYALSRGPKGELLIDLQGARIATGNNARRLDLSFFDTVVASVRARRLSRTNVRVVITLKEHTAYRLERRGRYIYVYFRG